MNVSLGDELLDAIASVLRRDGLAGLSLSAVADEAEMSRVTLHRHGVTRGSMLQAVTARASADLRSALWPALTATGDAASRLSSALSILCDVAERHAAVLGALYHAPDAPHATTEGRPASFDFTEPFERMLLDGGLDGSLRSDDPADDAVLVVNAVTWTYLHLRASHGWTARRAAERTIALATAHVTP